MCIVQARMTSSRLPGKVLMLIEGKPVLDYLFAQLKFVKKLDKVILATTLNQEDDPIIDFAKSRGIDYFRGSEPDVLERFYLAASQNNAQHIMRITGDCPLIDPDVCSRVIDCYLNEQVDLVNTGTSFAEGLDCEVFSFSALETAHQAATKISEREHVTLYIHQHIDDFKKLTLENSTNDSKFRITLDEKEDFQVIEAIIRGIENKEDHPIEFKKVKEFLENHTEVSQLNSSIVRNEGLKKSLAADH